MSHDSRQYVLIRRKQTLTNLSVQLKTRDPFTNSMLEKVEVYLNNDGSMDRIVIGGTPIDRHEVSRLKLLIEALLINDNILAKGIERCRTAQENENA